MKFHSQVHTGENPNNAPIAKYAFSVAGDLRTHFMTHSGEKPKNAPNAKIHSLRRTFEILFKGTHWRKSKKCSDCKYAFFVAGDLRTHFMTHSGEEPKNAANAKMPSVRRLFEIPFKSTHWRKSKKCSDCKYAFL